LSEFETKMPEAKAICSECGAEILAATAARTNGLCMACKQGIRQQLESSKKYYEEKRKPDPFRDYWKDLVQRVYQTPEGFEGLSPKEKTYFAVCILDGEVYNGGLHQFFSNTSGECYAAALNGLAELGAFRSRELLMAARSVLFPDGNMPRDTQSRRALLNARDESEIEQQLAELDEKYCADQDELGERLRKYALENHLVKLP
jgi:hypothetical protein